MPTGLMEGKAKLIGPTTRDCSSERVTSENKGIHTPPPPLHSKLRCLLFSIGRLNSSTTLHGGDGGGKAVFSRF